MDKAMTPFSLNLRGRLVVCDRPQVMGIVNVTPDSFYCGSRLALTDLRERVERMVADGADMLDLGGYSSRPGANEVSVADELERLLPAIQLIKDNWPEIPLSVDTFRAEVARKAVEAGTDIVNDISGGDLDPEMWPTVAELRVPYILMHMRGTPATMSQYTHYKDVTAEVVLELSKKIRQLALLGVADIIVDPGFGFAKTLEQNYELLRHLDVVSEALERPMLVGLSRKSMLYRLLDVAPEEALNATTVVDTIALLKGAAILRVHDVKECKETVRIVTQLKG